MIEPRQFLELIIRPTLAEMSASTGKSFGGLVAERLLLGTALVESGLSALKQHGKGPALSVFQIEPATAKDLMSRWPGEIVMRKFGAQGLTVVEQLPGNMYLAAAIARMVYYRCPLLLPSSPGVFLLAEYWKAHYNTVLGAGKPEMFVAAWQKSGAENLFAKGA